MPLSLHSRVVVSDDQVFTTVGEEAVILGLSDGVYYGLDPVGARIWALLATPRRVTELVSAVVADFDVAPDRCGQDVLALLDSLVARGLIREVPEGDDAPVP